VSGTPPTKPAFLSLVRDCGFGQGYGAHLFRARIPSHEALALKAEVLHLENRSSESLEAIEEAEALVEITERRNWSAELYRLRGVFLATTGADETQIEASFSAAIRIAIEQKSISLAKRAEASYAEYRQKRAH
jgi:hypothetical protein